MSSIEEEENNNHKNLLFFNETQIPSLELQNLRVIKPLGRGAKGVVFLVKNDAEFGSEHLALKLILRSSIENKKHNAKNGGAVNEYKRVTFEQRVLSRLNHPLLPRLRGVLAADKVVGYAIDYCPGGNLNSLRKKQIEKMFSDDVIRFYAAELVLALEYLHDLGIVYRDLKPENVMIQENGHIMLVDFDLSTKLSPRPSPQYSPLTNSSSQSPQNSPKNAIKKKRHSRSASLVRCCYTGVSPYESDDSVKPETNESSDSTTTSEKTNSFVGTEDYVAPEVIIGKGHDFAVDWWSFGVLLYEMLYGTTPFRGVNRKETFYRILSKEPELVGAATPLRDLIRKLLEKDPKRRISVEEIKGHEFFKMVEWDSLVGISRPPYIPEWTDINHDDDENEGIKDVECFVEGIFLSGEKDHDKIIEQSGRKESKQDIPPNQEFCVF